MITHIQVKNFKSWQDSDIVKLAPLTGFFGTNSSGKSSLLQMLLLLKQTIGTDKVLFFGDESSLVNLGSFPEVIHGHKEEELLELEFGCKHQEVFEIEVLGKHSDGYFVDVPIPIDNFSFNTALRVDGSELKTERFRYRFESCDIPEIRWESYNLRYRNLLGEEDGQTVRIKNCYGEPVTESDDILGPLSSAFEKLFAHVYPLGPTRVHPQRYYHWDDKDPTDVGLWGDKVIDALLCAHMRRMKISKEGEEATIENRVSEWLQEMDLAHSFSLEPIGALKDDNYKVQIQKSATSPVVTLADMGYGLADVLPMLVLCYYTPEGSTLILEQPGIHLHPKAQADLADLLIEVIKERNLQILVESHSEHFLTRLQLCIAEQKIAASDTALYFCENESGVSTIKSLDVDELGNITNWPPDFFGNVRGDLVKMTREQMKRQKETEGE